MRKIALLAAALVLTGAGCKQKTELAVNAGLTPISAPLSALERSRETLADAQAKAEARTGLVSDRRMIGLVLLNGAPLPPGAAVAETFGCKDRIVLAEVAKQDGGEAIQNVLSALFTGPDGKNVLYDQLAGAELKIEKVLESKDEKVTRLWVMDEAVAGGICDDAAVKAEIDAAIGRLKPSYWIYLNAVADR